MNKVFLIIGRCLLMLLVQRNKFWLENANRGEWILGLPCLIVILFFRLVWKFENNG